MTQPGMSIGWVFGFILLAIVVGLLVRGMYSRRRYRRIPEAEDPFAILKARYARGEISEAEFEHMKDELAD